MLNIEEIRKHAKYAKTEIDLSSYHLKIGCNDVDYILSMLDEARKQLDIIIEHTQQKEL